MGEAGQCQLRSSQPTADLTGGFQHEHRRTAFCQRSGGGQAVWAAADDDGVRRVGHASGSRARR